MKRNTPGCSTNDCCSPCPSCNEITALIISGLNSGGLCPTGCEARNGTYIIRTAGTQFAACGWTGFFALDNCGGFLTNPLRYTGNPFCGGNGWLVNFTFASGLVRVDASIGLSYLVQDVLTGEERETNYSASYRLEAETCADLIGVPLPQIGTQSNICGTPTTTTPTGDICNIFGATLTLG